MQPVVIITARIDVTIVNRQNAPAVIGRQDTTLEIRGDLLPWESLETHLGSLVQDTTHVLLENALDQYEARAQELITKAAENDPSA